MQNSISLRDSATARDISQLHHLWDFLTCPLHWMYVLLIGLPEEWVLLVITQQMCFVYLFRASLLIWQITFNPNFESFNPFLRKVSGFFSIMCHHQNYYYSSTKLVFFSVGNGKQNFCWSWFLVLIWVGKNPVQLFIYQPEVKTGNW